MPISTVRKAQAKAVMRVRMNPSIPSRAFASLVASANETRFVDVAFTAYNFDTTGSIAHINIITTGTSVNQRSGKKTLMKSLQCRGNVSNNTTAIINDCALLIVYDRRPTGALPAITDILNTATPQSFNNDTNSGRFQILKRMDFMLRGTVAATIALDSGAASCDFFLDLKNKPLVNKAVGSGAIADIEEGALYLVTVGQIAAGAGAATGSLGFRLRFLDH